MVPKTRPRLKKLLQAKNESNAQPVFSRELAKVYMHAQDPHFAEHTCGDVSRLIDAAYEGSTKERFQKFLRSQPVKRLMDLRLIETTSTHFLEAFAHPKTLRRNARSVFDHVCSWCLANACESLFSKTNKKGVRLLSDPLAVFWCLLEEEGRTVARLLISSGYDASRGGRKV